MPRGIRLVKGNISMERIQTRRLILRRWLPGDLEPFAAMNADPRMMEYFPKLLAREESDAMADRLQKQFDEKGFGLWAVEIPGAAPFAGFIGLTTTRFEARFTPCVEVAWRLSAESWGHGYATEGAAAALDFAFQTLRLNEVVSMTVPENHRSRRVMEKLGMVHDVDGDFDHPLLPPGHRFSRHVLYRTVSNRAV